MQREIDFQFVWVVRRAEREIDFQFVWVVRHAERDGLPVCLGCQTCRERLTSSLFGLSDKQREIDFQFVWVVRHAERD